ncbi:hypothetical protein NIES2130_02005 [Scytonema sp. HK-05]|nr:hypothetical protein NIES2130_02005 [Scytonema sp. HK-05]
MERELLPRSQPQAGNLYWEALPCLTAAVPLQGHFQVEPPRPRLKTGFWVKLTPMGTEQPLQKTCYSPN